MNSILSKLSFILLFLSINAFAQDAKDSNRISINASQNLSIDRYDNLFVVDGNYNIHKFSPEGEKLVTFSPQKLVSITNIEAWNSVKIFLFNKDYQEYTILDRLLGLLSITTFNPNEIGFVSYATSALDGNIWVVDNSDFSLKKIELKSNNVIATTKLELIVPQREIEILHMKEYQNFLYISTINNGILVFDNFGSYKKKLPFNSIEHLTFYKDNLCFSNGLELTLFNLYKLNQSTHALPKEGIRIFEIDEEKIYSVDKQGILSSSHHSLN